VSESYSYMILVSDTVKNTTYIHDIYHIHMYVYKLYTKSIERERIEGMIIQENKVCLHKLRGLKT